MIDSSRCRPLSSSVSLPAGSTPARAPGTPHSSNWTRAPSRPLPLTSLPDPFFDLPRRAWDPSERSIARLLAPARRSRDPLTPDFSKALCNETRRGGKRPDPPGYSRALWWGRMAGWELARGRWWSAKGEQLQSGQRGLLVTKEKPGKSKHCPRLALAWVNACILASESANRLSSACKKCSHCP